MGKAAENEKIKLRAMFLNNLAVGCALAGGLVPFIALYQRMPEFKEALIELRRSGFDEVIISKYIEAVVGYLAGAIIGLGLAASLHEKATQIVSRIKS